MSIPFSDEWIEKVVKWRVPEKYFNTLELELKFLRTFLKYTANRCFEYQNLKNLLKRAEAVDLGARRKLKYLSCLSREQTATKLNNMAADMVNEVKLVKSEIREVHSIVSRSSRSHICISNELLMEFIDSLVENLKYLISFNVDLVVPLKRKLEALEGKLGFLKILLMFAGKRCKENDKINNLFTHAKVAADNAAYLSYSCLVDEMDEDMLDILVFDLSDLVRNIDPVTPEVRQIYIGVLKASSKSSRPDSYTSETDKIDVDFVKSLLENVTELLRAGWTVPMRGQIEILQEELALLRSFLMDPSNLYTENKTLNNLLTQSKVISSKAGSVVYSLYDNKMNKETTEMVYSSLVELLEEIMLFKVEITKIYPKAPCPKFPRTDELGFLDCFLGNLRKLLNYRSDTITCLNLPVEPLLEELQFLRYFLGKIATHHTEQEKLDVLWTQIIDAAYKTEYIIDSLLVGNGHMWHHMLWLSEVRKEIEVLKAEVNKIGETKMHNSEGHHGAEISGQASSEATSPEMDEVVVGYEDEEEKIVEYLAGGSAKLGIVSIVGMPGLGKTHLARKIYNNHTVEDHFYVRAWCYVSQVYSRKYLLTRILSQLAEHTQRMSEMTDEELAHMLYNSLRGKRYLILMDDLWDVEAWDALIRSFPDDHKGSRIMLTSRFHNLDLKASVVKIHHLRPFSEDESWQLLQEKLFQRESCPSELLEVGKQIAKNCNGLPLEVVVVAGILARDKKQHFWREVANSQSSYIVDDPKKKSMKAIELSFKHLPDYLKPCFLYIGAFHKNKYIPVRKLICLWIAEGFVQKVEQKSLENIAENYLMDLIGRSLIIIAKRRSTGDIKLCSVHDLVRDFCLEKAKEDNFLQLIERMPASELSRYIILKQRLICSNRPNLFHVPKACDQHVRSLLFFGPSNLFSAEDSFISSICEKFKLLRVLDLAWITIWGTFPCCITSLAHLRYLAVFGDFDSIPSSIAKLWNLEAFIVKGSSFQVHLPDTIWNMVNLRHLHISDSSLLSQPSCGGISRLFNLQTISTLLLSYGDDSVEFMNGCANLKNLRCIFLESWDVSENCNRLPILGTLSQLESLRVSYRGKSLCPYGFSFPSNIKKLTMSKFRLPWNQISIIGKLPKLEVLKLLSEAFQGEEWDMGDGEFPKLKFLKLADLDIRQWSVSSDDFPPLEQLVLQSCPQLEEIPSCLGDIPTLNTIEVSWCAKSLTKVVKQIHEEQLDMGNQELKVVIKHRRAHFYGY